MRALAISALFVLAITGLGFDPLGIIRFDEQVRPGDQMVVFVSMENFLNTDLDKVKVTAFIPQLGVIYRSDEFDIEGDGHHMKFLLVDIPVDAQKGIYVMQISAQNENDREFRSRAFRYIEIV